RRKSALPNCSSASPPESGHRGGYGEGQLRATTGLMHRSNCVLFDQFVGTGEKRICHGKPERLGGLEIERKLINRRASTGRSAGFLPLRIRSTYSVARQNWSSQSGP